MKIPVTQLSPMQKEMIAIVRSNQNVILLSPTGSGKTLAYMIPLCERLLLDRGPQVIIIVPSRELALQGKAVFDSLKSPCQSIALYGGRSTMDEHRRLGILEPAVLFATPGRLLDHIRKGNFGLEHIKTLVLDEFDKCLELGFQEQIFEIINSLPFIRQTLLTSATQCGELPCFIQEKIGGEIKILDYLPLEKVMVSRLKLYTVLIEQKDKLQGLGHLLTHLSTQSCIVFVAHRESVERVSKYLRGKGFCVEGFHGGMEQEHRERSLFRFRAGSSNILIATDLAARGLDISNVHAIIHYHLPYKEEVLTHRNGRTARWEATGKVFFLVGPEETLPEFIGKIERLEVPQTSIQPSHPLWTTLYIGRGRKDKLSKGDIVGFLCKKGGIKQEQIGMIELFEHHSYVAISSSILKRCLSLVQGEKIKGMRTIIEEMYR